MMKTPLNHYSHRAMQRGLSLIELMVGLTIGLMLTLGLFTMIGGQSAAFKVQDDFARMQENGTFALRYIGDSLRMAGFYGYATDPALINTTVGGVATTTDCGSAFNLPAANWALQLDTPVQGFPALTPLTVNDVLPCIDADNFVAGPILVVRSAAGFRIPDEALATDPPDGDLSDGLAAQENYETNIYVQSDPNAGLLFYGDDFSTLKAAGTTRSTVTGADIDIFEYRAHVYYVRPCSRPNGGGTTCTGAADDGGQPIPTLVRQELIGSAMTEVPLVEGIDLVDYRFGIDNNNDGVTDTFTTTPAAADWRNVVAVKVSVLVRSLTLAPQYNDAGKTYDLDGDNIPDYDCTLATTANACNYARKVFSQTFQVRNVAQRRGA